MSDPQALLTTLGASISTAVAIGGVIKWLVWPRFRSSIEEVARGVAGVRQELDGNNPDTVARHARVAARAAAQLPELVEQIGVLSARQDAIEQGRDEDRDRLSNIEAALVALMAPELRRRAATSEGEFE